MTKLDPVEQALLLELSRQALQLSVRGRVPAHALFQHLREARVLGGGVFSRPGRVFVTLRKKGRLRGCIGTIGEGFQLGPITAENSAAAALRDPRFHPVQPSELDQLQVEITLLGAPERLRETEQLMIGRHGLLVSRGLSRGLLLPQVASELNLDREGFLSLCCRKAGLPENAWRVDAGVDFFEAQHFGHDS